MKYWKSSFLLHHPIYTVRSSETEDMQILWKFFLSNLAIIKKRYYTETCSNLSQYCFVLKIYILFFKIQPIKSLRDLFLRNYYWENSWMVRQVLYLRIKGKLLLVLFTKHQWVLDYIICFATETNWLGNHYLHVPLIFILHRFYC